MVMQENHSFDHDFGMLPLATGTLYYLGPCVVDDHQCVDGLSCQRDLHTGVYTCQNANLGVDGPVVSFHATDCCVAADLNHAGSAIQVLLTGHRGFATHSI
jgi:phospholipase C